MADRNLADLLPRVEAAASAAIAACEAKGLPLLVTCTYRSAADQNALYAQGRTTPGAIVTVARGFQSMHQFRCALDIVPLGKAPFRNGRKSPQSSKSMALNGARIGRTSRKCRISK